MQCWRSAARGGSWLPRSSQLHKQGCGNSSAVLGLCYAWEHLRSTPSSGQGIAEMWALTCFSGAAKQGS